MRDYEVLVDRLREAKKHIWTQPQIELYPMMDDAADAIEELSKRETPMPEWISVKDRLPPYGDRILVTDGIGVWEGYLSYYDGFMRNTGMSIVEIYNSNVTHWMPMPEPPKEEKECI